MIVAIAGRRAATVRILVDATLADAPHTFTDDPAAADLVVVLDPTAGLGTLSPDSIVVAYADDTAVVAATASTPARVVTFGLSPSADVRAEAIASTVDGTAFVLVAGEHRQPVSVGILGESVVPLVLAALAVSGAAGIATDDAVAALAGVREAAPRDMRVSRLDTHTLLVDDTGDGSPLSTTAALKALAELGIDGTRTVAVLGDLDLGADVDAVESRDEHDRIGRLVVRLNVSRLIVVGQSARHIHNAAGLEGSWDGESVLVDTLDQAYDLLNDTEFTTEDSRVPTVVLVKSSYEAGLSALADRILANEPRKATA